jgi:signal transduction histidine kinase
VIDGVCESLEAWARSKGVSVMKRVADALPNVMLDKARISQVLMNLMGNAIKFTPRGGRVTVEAKLNQERAIEVSVTDTGIGIAKEDLPKLFSKFQQVGERTASDISGTGLGLVIVKEIIELHHGRIWVESELKRGARFAFTLPLEPAASPQSPPPRPA